MPADRRLVLIMLQFHLNKFFGLKFKTHGMAIPSEEGLKLVFRHGEAPAKLFAEDIESALVTWNNFAGMRVEKSFLTGTKIVLQVNSSAWLKELPGAANHREAASATTELELRVHKSNVDAVPEFERQVASYQSGKTDEDIDDFIDDVRDMLDR